MECHILPATQVNRKGLPGVYATISSEIVNMHRGQISESFIEDRFQKQKLFRTHAIEGPIRRILLSILKLLT